MTDEGPELRLRDGATQWRKIDGRTIVLDVDSSAFVGLNSSATVLWTALIAGTTRARLIRLLIDAYELSSAQAAGDVDAFLDVCEQRGLLS